MDIYKWDEGWGGSQKENIQFSTHAHVWSNLQNNITSLCCINYFTKVENTCHYWRHTNEKYIELEIPPRSLLFSISNSVYEGRLVGGIL